MAGVAVMPEPRLVDVAGATLAVREWGPPEGRPLVFWHALGPATSGAMLNEVAPELASHHGVRTIALDAPGYGASPALPRERYSAPALAELVWGLVDRLGAASPVLMGHSWGGVVVEAAAAARRDHVAGLVLLDSGHGDYQDLPGFPADTSWEALLAEASSPDRRLRVADEAELRRELEPVVRRPVTEELLDAIRAGMREDGGMLVGIPAPEARAAAMAGLCTFRATSTWSAIAGSGIPILLLAATEPAEARAQNEALLPAFREVFPDAEIHLVADAGHGLLSDAPDQVAALVGAWLDRLPRPG